MNTLIDTVSIDNCMYFTGKNTFKSITSSINFVNNNDINNISLYDLERYLKTHDLVIRGTIIEFTSNIKKFGVAKSLKNTIRFNNFSYFGDMFMLQELTIGSETFIRIGRVKYPNLDYKIGVSSEKLSNIAYKIFNK